MAQEAWRAYLELAIGATDATRKKATKAVRQLVGKGAVSGEQLQSMAEDLLRTSSASREAMANLVRFELEKALGRLGLATADEVNSLSAKVRELEAKLRAATAVPPDALESHDGPPVGAEVVAKRTVAKKAVAKKAVATKTVPTKALPGASEPLAPPPAKTTAAKTTPAKTTPAKTTSARTTPAKEPAARKTAVKKVAAAKKVAAKKAVKRTAAPRRPAGGIA